VLQTSSLGKGVVDCDHVIPSVEEANTDPTATQRDPFQATALHLPLLKREDLFTKDVVRGSADVLICPGPPATQRDPFHASVVHSDTAVDLGVHVVPLGEVASRTLPDAAASQYDPFQTIDVQEPENGLLRIEAHDIPSFDIARLPLEDPATHKDPFEARAVQPFPEKGSFKTAVHVIPSLEYARLTEPVAAATQTNPFQTTELHEFLEKGVVFASNHVLPR
jgi:hypothetical protein